MPTYELLLPEPAPAHIEALLAMTCPRHIATTLDGGECQMCLLDEQDSREELNRAYNRLTELEAEQGQHSDAYVRLEERAWMLEGATR